MPDKHNGIISEYLAAFRAQLRGMSENEKNDLVLELEDHILTRLAEDGAPTGEVLAASAAAHAATSAARAAQSAAQADAVAKVTELAAVRAEQAARKRPADAGAMSASYSAESIHAVLAALGTPEELARRYDAVPEEGAPPPPRWHLPARLALVLAIIMALGLGAVSLAAYSTWRWHRLRQGYSVTDPGERKELLEQLTSVCALYQSMPRYYGTLHSNSRLFGRDCRQNMKVLHAARVTHIAPLQFADAISARYTDTQTVIWQPSLRAYEILPPGDIEGSTYGPSLLLGLLTGKIGVDQCRINERDVKKIFRQRDRVTYEFNGAFFGYGDAEYRLSVDIKENRLLNFRVRRPDTTSMERCRVYTEHYLHQRTDLPLVPEALTLNIPAEARPLTSLVGLNFRRPMGWKGQDLIGQPMVPFSVPDVQTGKIWTADDVRGQPALVAVLATWIPWDRLYMAAFAELQRRYAATGLRFVVLAPEVERRITDAFLAENPLPYPLLTDFTGWEAPHFAAGRFYAPCDITPTFLALDATGRVVGASGRYYSPISDDITALTGLLVPALGEETVARIENARKAELAALPEAELLARAEQCFSREDDFTGKEYLQAAIDRHHSLPAKLRLCQLYVEYRNEEGKELAEECLAETTASPYPYLMLGDYHRTERRDHTRAMREYARALKYDPDCWQAHFKRGQSLATRGHDSEAVVAYRKALRVVPDNSYVWQQLADSLRDLGRDAELQTALQNVTAFHGLRGASDELLQVHGYGGEAEMFAQRGQHAQALARQQQALRYDPGNRGKLRGLANTLIYRVQRPAEALPVLDQLLHYDRNAIDLRLQASALEMLGRTNEALARYEEVLRLDPGNWMAHVAIGTLYERRGDMARARTVWQEARMRFPDTLGSVADEEISTLGAAW